MLLHESLYKLKSAHLFREWDMLVYVPVRNNWNSQFLFRLQNHENWNLPIKNTNVCCHVKHLRASMNMLNPYFPATVNWHGPVRLTESWLKLAEKHCSGWIVMREKHCPAEKTSRTWGKPNLGWKHCAWNRRILPRILRLTDSSTDDAQTWNNRLNVVLSLSKVKVLRHLSPFAELRSHKLHFTVPRIP